MKRKLILIGSLLFAVGIAVSSFAQDPTRNEKHRQVRAYVEENILPVMADRRLQFDEELSYEEKQKVAELRERMEVFRAEGRAFRKERKTGGSGERPQLTAEDRAKIYARKKELRQIETAAYEIIDAHEEYFQALHESLEPEIAVWKADIKATVGTEGPHRRKGPHGHGGNFHGAHAHHKLHDWASPVRFLLMDPENPQLPGDEFRESRLYPNPAQHAQTLELILQKGGNVKVDLYDNQGNYIKTLFNNELSKGKQQLNLNLGELPKAQYLYKISTPDGSQTQRVVVE